jgi:type IV pilus assembly protein PilA
VVVVARAVASWSCFHALRLDCIGPGDDQGNSISQKSISANSAEGDVAMLTSAQSQAEPSRISLWWLRVVRTVALSSLLAILLPWYAAIFKDLKPQDRFDLVIPILFCPLWLPYAWVFWGLRSNVGTEGAKKTLAVALDCGLLILVLFSFLLAVTSFGVDRRLALVYGLVVFLQIALILSTIKAYYAMERKPGDLRILATRLWVPIVGITVTAIILPNLLLSEKRAPFEASAVGSLRTLNTAQVEYARAHSDRGFASSLAELGPTGDTLIDSVLASGKKSSYVFILTAGPLDSRGKVVRYIITARPQHYGKDTTRSFFTDESGILRFTTENRAATAQDPTL